MSPALFVALSLYLLIIRRRRLAAECWIHPTIERRGELGEFHRLLQEYRNDENRFQSYFRLKPAEFDAILEKISPAVYRMDTNYRRAITPAERLSICLRFNSRFTFNLKYLIYITVTFARNNTSIPHFIFLHWYECLII